MDLKVWGCQKGQKDEKLNVMPKNAKGFVSLTANEKDLAFVGEFYNVKLVTKV
jgi:hypothetical protein